MFVTATDWFCGKWLNVQLELTLVLTVNPKSGDWFSCSVTSRTQVSMLGKILACLHNSKIGSFRSKQHILIQSSKVAKGPLPSTALFLWPFKTLILQTVPLNPHGHDLFARLAGQWISIGSDTMEKDYGAGWRINHAVWYLNTKREPKSQANGRCTHLSTIALVTIFALKFQVSLASRKDQRAKYHVLMTC